MTSGVLRETRALAVRFGRLYPSLFILFCFRPETNVAEIIKRVMKGRFESVKFAVSNQNPSVAKKKSYRSIGSGIFSKNKCSLAHVTYTSLPIR
jgi:hypothetical protein